MTAYWCSEHYELPYVSDRLAKLALIENLKIERKKKALRLKIKMEKLKVEKKKEKNLTHRKNPDSDSGHMSDEEVRIFYLFFFIKTIPFTENYFFFSSIWLPIYQRHQNQILIGYQIC